ncbi:MAG: sulfatase [Planctomycetota bacterium]
MCDAHPNILYLHSHDSGRLFSPFGGPVSTPNLQALADQGVCYRNAFCVGPTCSPSRAALLTGQYPHQVGQWGLSNFGYPLGKPERHLVKFLQSHGYRAALMGVQHVTADERDLGYNDVRSEVIGGATGRCDPAMSAPRVAEAACDWLVQHGRGTAPWFLDVGMVETHTNAAKQIQPDRKPSDQKIDRATPPYWLQNTIGSRRWQANFDAMAAMLDDAIGRVLARLDALGLREKTLVIYTTDHGPGVPMAKCTLTDAGLGVGLIASGAGSYIGGQTVHGPISHLDVFPTICRVANLETPDHLEGQPLPTEACLDDAPRSLFAEINVHGRSGRQPERSVRHGRFKLVRRFYTDPSKISQNADPSGVKDDMFEAGWPTATTQGQASREDVFDSLYDLRLDPTERRDRSGDTAYAEVYADLDRRLTSWMQRTDDALRPGGPGIPQPQPIPTLAPV